MQSTELGKIIEQLLDDYYNRDSKVFRERIEGNFKVFEELENIQDPKMQAIGNFLYSIGLSLLAGKLESYKFMDTRDTIKEKANQAVQKAFEYFKKTEEWKILEQIYDQMIFLLFDQIPRELIPIEERLKLYEKLIAYCNAQEEISEKLGDKAFLSRIERIPYRYIMGEFRQLLETGTLSIQNAVETNNKLKEKINELEKFPFPKAKFWAKKWKRKYICDIEGNNKISFNGGTLIVNENTLEFKNDCYNRGMKLKFSIDPESKVVEQKACPEIKVLRAGIIIPHASPKILQKYEDDLQLEFRIERPIQAKTDAFERDTFSLNPKRSDDRDYFLMIETDANVVIQENTTLITENDLTLRINYPALEMTTKDGITHLKFNLIEKVTDREGARSTISDKEELEYLGYGRSLNFTLYCNINPSFSGTFIFTDPKNWKYCLGASLYMNKLKFKQGWYPNFLNFDYSPIMFLSEGKIPEKFLEMTDGDFKGFLNDIGKEFPGILKQIVIFGEFMEDYPMEERRKHLLDLINLMASISQPLEEEISGILLITSSKQYYEEMKQIEEELNKLNEKLNKLYKSKAILAIDIQYINDNEFISSIVSKNKRILDHDFDDIYLVDDPMLAFALVPLVKYTQSAVLLKDELEAEKTQSFIKKAKTIIAIGTFDQIPKKVTTKLVSIDSSDIQEEIGKINGIFKSKLSEDYQKYMESDLLQRLYPGYTRKELLGNTILTSISEMDYSYLTMASNYAANKPATINLITQDIGESRDKISGKLKNLRFSETKSIEKSDLKEIGEYIKGSLHPKIQEGLNSAETIIILSKVPIPFELYDFDGSPLCISKAMGRVCSTDIADTSIMLTLNIMRQMIMKSGEKVVVIAPKYEGDMALEGAVNEAKLLAAELKKNFEGKIVKKIDEIIDKRWLYDIFQESLKIIHFSGHGHCDGNKSCLILSSGEKEEPEFLFPEDLEKFVKQSGIIRGYPLVFTSACITGQIQEAGSGLEGLAAQFIKSGATCFIGTLWEIMDDSAREFATHLYGNLNKPDRNLGDLILDSRRNVNEKCLIAHQKDGIFDPTCYAFILFGDPTIKLRY